MRPNCCPDTETISQEWANHKSQYAQFGCIFKELSYLDLDLDPLEPDPAREPEAALEPDEDRERDLEPLREPALDPTGEPDFLDGEREPDLDLDLDRACEAGDPDPDRAPEETDLDLDFLDREERPDF